MWSDWRGVIFPGRGGDKQQRVAKLREKKLIQIKLSESIPLGSFSPFLDMGYLVEHKNNAGRKRIDPLVLF